MTECEGTFTKISSDVVVVFFFFENSSDVVLNDGIRDCEFLKVKALNGYNG